MASETIYGYFGQKGAGKTHELVRVILARLKEGRRVVAVMPQLDVDKVARFLGDPTVRDRLIVKDYTDVTDDPNFFPNEHVIRSLQQWKRFDIDYAVEEPTPESPRAPMPENAKDWRKSVVIPGDLVVIDEAWRWLESAKDIPKPLKAALHMARHWHGPVDWRNPEDIAKYTSPDWFPGYGGPEWVDAYEDQPVIDERTGEPTGKTKKVKVRKFKGGDGTPMVTTNILFASQDFFGLARSLRGQIDQTTLLVSIRDSYFPTLLKKATDGKEQYLAYTFEAADMPTRRQMLAGLEKGEKLWLTEETITHDDGVHSLYEYATGYAQEKRADDKSNLANNPHWKKIKRQGLLMLATLALAIGMAVYFFMSMPTTNSLVSDASKTKIAAPGTPGSSVQPTGQGATARVQTPGSSSQPAAQEMPLRPGFAGKVGDVIAIDAGGSYSLVMKSDVQVMEGGHYRMSVDGGVIDSAQDLAMAGAGGLRGSGSVGDDEPVRGQVGRVDADTVRKLSLRAKSGDGSSPGIGAGNAVAGPSVANPFRG